MDGETEERPKAAPLRLRFMGALAGLARRSVDLVLPPACAACRASIREAHGLCALCWGGLRFIERPYCERLGIPFGYELGPGALSAEAIADPPPYERARAAVMYEGVARPLVHAMKYHDRPELGRLLGRMTARAGRDLLSQADVIVPVPLHRGRLLVRRFNQSQAMADEISRLSAVRVEPLMLERIKATRSQVGLSGYLRDENVRAAFRVRADRKADLTGLKVVLVDDVLTTGATVAAATRALKRGGAATVDVLTFARVATAGPLHV